MAGLHINRGRVGSCANLDWHTEAWCGHRLSLLDLCYLSIDNAVLAIQAGESPCHDCCKAVLNLLVGKAHSQVPAMTEDELTALRDRMQREAFGLISEREARHPLQVNARGDMPPIEVNTGGQG